jgi:serine/threonine-protein kinase RsbW
MDEPTLEMVLEGPADATSLERMHALLERFWSTGPEVDDAWRMMFVTAVAEIAANTVEHSRAEEGVTSLRLRVQAFPDRVEACLQDDGAAIDVRLDPELPNQQATRGRGMAIVRSMVDEFSYSRVAELNSWLIVKRLPAGGP